jgi:hypothetical protein
MDLNHWPIIPLQSTNCLFFVHGSEDQTLRDVYQSPIPGDPSLNDEREGMFVKKKDFKEKSKATVIEISGSHTAEVDMDLYLPVEFVPPVESAPPAGFGDDGQPPTGHWGSSPPELAKTQKTPFKWCCGTQSAVDD